MNKRQLIEALRQRHEWLRGDDAHAIVDSLLDIIGDTLAKDEKVVISGFGTFDVTHVATRFVTPPHKPDGVIRGAIEVPAHRRPVFRAGKGLKSRVAG